MLHRTRHLFIRQQTSVINAIRAHLAEFGIAQERLVSRRFVRCRDGRVVNGVGVDLHLAQLRGRRT